MTHLIICLDRLLDLLIFISGLTRPKGRQLTLYSLPLSVPSLSYSIASGASNSWNEAGRATI